MNTTHRYSLPLIVMCNGVVALLHYLNFLQMTTNAHLENALAIDTLHLLMGPIALLGLCLAWTQRPTTSALLLSSYAGMSLLALQQMNQVHTALQLGGTSHMSGYWLQAALAFLLIMWVLPQSLQTASRESDNAEAGAILPIHESSQENAMAPNAQSATGLALPHNESGHASVMGAPAKTHRVAA